MVYSLFLYSLEMNTLLKEDCYEKQKDREMYCPAFSKIVMPIPALGSAVVASNAHVSGASPHRKTLAASRSARHGPQGCLCAQISRGPRLTGTAHPHVLSRAPRQRRGTVVRYTPALEVSAWV